MSSQIPPCKLSSNSGFMHPSGIQPNCVLHQHSRAHHLLPPFSPVQSVICQIDGCKTTTCSILWPSKAILRDIHTLCFAAWNCFRCPRKLKKAPILGAYRFYSPANARFEIATSDRTKYLRREFCKYIHK